MGFRRHRDFGPVLLVTAQGRLHTEGTDLFLWVFRRLLPVFWMIIAFVRTVMLPYCLRRACAVVVSSSPLPKIRITGPWHEWIDVALHSFVTFIKALHLHTSRGIFFYSERGAYCYDGSWFLRRAGSLYLYLYV